MLGQAHWERIHSFIPLLSTPPPPPPQPKISVLHSSHLGPLPPGARVGPPVQGKLHVDHPKLEKRSLWEHWKQTLMQWRVASCCQLNTHKYIAFTTLEVWEGRRKEVEIYCPTAFKTRKGKGEKVSRYMERALKFSDEDIQKEKPF